MVRARLFHTYDDFNVHNLNCYSPLNPRTRKFSNYVLIPRVPLLDEIKLLKNLKKDLLTTVHCWSSEENAYNYDDRGFHLMPTPMCQNPSPPSTIDVNILRKFKNDFDTSLIYTTTEQSVN